MENWKDVVGAEGRYEVSDLGRVKSLVAPGGVKLLKPSPHVRSGHMMVLIAPTPGERKMKYVHRLVLESFVELQPTGLEGCHMDGNPGNNTLSNLRWGTRSSNLLDAVRHGTHHHAKKVHCPKGHEYDRVYYRRSGPKAGRSFRACSQCDAMRVRKH